MSPAEILAAMEETKRRRALLEGQQQQNMGTPIVGNTGLGQAISKIATSYLLGSGSKQLGQEDAQLRQQYADALKGEAGKYLETTQGQPGVDLPSIGKQNVGGVKANPKEAILAAMTSQFPEMQAVGKQGFAELLKKPDRLTQKDILSLSGFDPASRVAAALSGDIEGLRPDADVIVAGDQIFNKRDLKNGPVADARMRYTAPSRMGGDLYQQEDRPGGLFKKLDNAPKTTVSVAVDKGEDKFAEKLGTGVADAFLEARKQAEAAYRTKGTVQQLRELDAKGTFNTPVPDFAISLGQFSSSLGIPVDQAKLGNSEAYRQQLAKIVADSVLTGAGARAATDADRERFEQSLPGLIVTPQGRQQIFSMMDAAADQAIARNKSMQIQLQTNPKYKDLAGMLTYNPVDQQPGPGALPPQVPTQAGASGPSTPISLQDYLKMKGIGNAGR